MSMDSAAIGSPPPPSRLLTVLCFTLVYILWGSTFLAIRIAVEHLTPLTMGGVRFTIAGVLMLAIRASMGHRVFLPWPQLLRFACVGFLLWVTANVVLSWGELYIDTGLAALLVAIVPLWILLLERLTHSTDRLPPRGLVGIALGIVGVATLLWPDLVVPAHLGSRQLFGSFLVLGSSFSWAVGSVLAKRWQTGTDLFVVSGWQLLFGGLIAGFLALVTGQARLAEFTAPGVEQSLWAIAYLVCAGSMVGFTSYVWLLKHVPITKAATHTYVNPVVALLLGYFLHGERMDGYMVAGAVVVIVSVILVTGAKVYRVGPGGEIPELERGEQSG